MSKRVNLVFEDRLKKKVIHSDITKDVYREQNFLNALKIFETIPTFLNIKDFISKMNQEYLNGTVDKESQYKIIQELENQEDSDQSILCGDEKGKKVL